MKPTENWQHFWERYKTCKYGSKTMVQGKPHRGNAFFTMKLLLL